MNSFGSKEEARAWLERWKLVNDFERAEALSRSVDQRLEQLVSLFDSAPPRSSGDANAARQVECARRRWIRLKASIRG